MQRLEPLDCFSTKKNKVLLPTEQELKSISCLSSFGKSLNKRALSEELLECAIKDSSRFCNILLQKPFLLNYVWRVKSENSIILKYYKGLQNQLRFNTVFNDLIGLRLKVQEYPEEYPDYFRVVDMRNGKKNDDGYRGVHLYYQLDNYHYQVVIQLWSVKDYDFNKWSHEYGYKTLQDEELRLLREKCDLGIITCEEQYRLEVQNLERRN